MTHTQIVFPQTHKTWQRILCVGRTTWIFHLWTGIRPIRLKRNLKESFHLEETNATVFGFLTECLFLGPATKKKKKMSG